MSYATVSAVFILAIAASGEAADPMPPANIGYLGRGYNLVEADPLSLEGFELGGLRLDLQFDDTVDPNGYERGIGFTVQNKDECSTHFKCRAVESVKEYKQFLTTFLAGNLSRIPVDTSSFIGGLEHMKQTIEKEGMVAIVCHVECLVYTASIDVENPPSVEKYFPNILKEYGDGNSPSEECPELEVTHITNYVEMGSMAAIEYNVKRADWDKYMSKFGPNFNDDMAQLANGGMQSGEAASASTRELNDIVLQNQKLTVGQFYSSDLSAREWRNQTIERGVMMPIRVGLMPIEEVIDAKYVPPHMEFSESELAAKKEAVKRCRQEFEDSLKNKYGFCYVPRINHANPPMSQKIDYRTKVTYGPCYDGHEYENSKNYIACDPDGLVGPVPRCIPTPDAITAPTAVSATSGASLQAACFSVVMLFLLASVLCATA